MNSLRSWCASHARLALSGVAVATLAMSLGAAVPSGASSLSADKAAYCHTLLTFHSKAPTGSSAKGYQAYAKAYLPLWTKLASEAPNDASKTVLNEVVKILKYEAHSKNLKVMSLYIASHQKQWVKGWSQFSKDIISCASTLY